MKLIERKVNQRKCDGHMALKVEMSVEWLTRKSMLIADIRARSDIDIAMMPLK